MMREPGLRLWLAKPLTVFASHSAACTAVLEYIKRIYHHQRLRWTRRYNSPVAYERRHLEHATTA